MASLAVQDAAEVEATSWCHSPLSIHRARVRGTSGKDSCLAKTEPGVGHMRVGGKFKRRSCGKLNRKSVHWGNKMRRWVLHQRLPLAHLFMRSCPQTELFVAAPRALAYLCNPTACRVASTPGLGLGVGVGARSSSNVAVRQRVGWSVWRVTKGRFEGGGEQDAPGMLDHGICVALDRAQVVAVLLDFCHLPPCIYTVIIAPRTVITAHTRRPSCFKLHPLDASPNRWLTSANIERWLGASER